MNFEAYIPQWAHKTLFDIQYWQLIGLILALILGGPIKYIVEKVIDSAKFFTGKTGNTWDDDIIDAIEKPFGLFATCGFWLASIHILKFEGSFLDFLKLSIQAVFSLSIVWLFYRMVDVSVNYFILSNKNKKIEPHLAPVIAKAIKVVVIALGFLATLQNLGVNVMSLIAGLGLGGLAFALAAKDTCANLFGSIMIFLDQPFKIGDYIVVNGVDGTVEDIGFRCTRIRTFYNSVVSIPNSTIANSNVDNMGRREFRRVRTFLGLTYDTPANKLTEFRDGVIQILKNHPLTKKDQINVAFNNYNSSSLDFLVNFYIETADYASELTERERIFIDIFKLAENIGVSFAFPTQTLHVESLPQIETKEK